MTAAGQQADWSRCVFCGEPATTKDHLPPENLFQGSRNDLITVPACTKCNGGRSELDERFRQFVSLAVGVDHPGAAALWEPTHRGLLRNRRHMRELAQHTFELYPDLYINLQEVETVHVVIAAITRGLYWRHYNATLAPDVPIVIERLSSLKGLIDLGHDMQHDRIAGGDFIYHFMHAPDQVHTSLWFYEFHQKLFIMATTGLEPAFDEEESA